MKHKHKNQLLQKAPPETFECLLLSGTIPWLENHSKSMSRSNICCARKAQQTAKEEQAPKSRRERFLVGYKTHLQALMYSVACIAL